MATFEYDRDFHQKHLDSIRKQFESLEKPISDRGNLLTVDAKQKLSGYYKDSINAINSFFQNPSENSTYYIAPEQFNQIQSFFNGPTWNGLKLGLSASNFCPKIGDIYGKLQSYKNDVLSSNELTNEFQNLYLIYLAQIKQMLDELNSHCYICTAHIPIAETIYEIQDIQKKFPKIGSENVKLKSILSDIDNRNNTVNILMKIESEVYLAYQQSVGIQLSLHSF